MSIRSVVTFAPSCRRHLCGDVLVNQIVMSARVITALDPVSGPAVVAVILAPHEIKSYQWTKRDQVAQKMRTRRALLAAAGQLIADGRTPTVAEAADAALVSRATAYRYFPSREALLTEAPLHLGLPTVASLFGAADAPTDVEDRVALVHNAMFDHIRDREVQFRLFQRNSVLRSLHTERAESNLRPAFRLQLLDAALEPLGPEADAASLQQLKTALCVLIGTEAIIAMRDVVGLDHDEARAHGEWAVRQLVRAVRGRAPADSEDPRHSRRPRRRAPSSP